jgi:CRP-like cAMP-binding protein
MEPHVKNTAATHHHRPQQNALLAALSAVDRERLSNDLELVPLVLGQVLYESGQTMSHGYFPVDCIVSLLYVMKNGESAEIAVVGNDGMIGIALFMGGESTMSRAIVQNAGHAYRMKAQVLKDEFQGGGALSGLLLRSASALITQMVQTAACNRHHPVDQQFCRWMLLSLDRLPSNKITMTEKLIGNMLGLSADEVTRATDVLQTDGLIRYNAGAITVLDRPGIEERSCECYEVVKKECRRLLPIKVRDAA